MDTSSSKIEFVKFISLPSKVAKPEVSSCLLEKVMCVGSAIFNLPGFCIQLFSANELALESTNNEDSESQSLISSTLCSSCLNFLIDLPRASLTSLRVAWELSC